MNKANRKVLINESTTQHDCEQSELELVDPREIAQLLQELEDNLQKTYDDNIILAATNRAKSEECDIYLQAIEKIKREKDTINHQNMLLEKEIQKYRTSYKPGEKVGTMMVQSRTHSKDKNNNIEKRIAEYYKNNHKTYIESVKKKKIFIISIDG